MHTVRISCNCETCKINAAKVGASFPLAAMITPQAAAVLGITTDRRATARTFTHGAVYTAHDPIVGPYQRMAIPV